MTHAAAMRWGLVAVGAVSTAALLVAPYGSAADRTLPITLVACAAVTAVVVLESRRACLQPGALFAVGAVLLVLAVVAPPRTSHDLWSYAMYGRIAAVHHADPYRVRPSAFASDPALLRVSPGWRAARSVYGPAFTEMSAGLAHVVGLSALRTRLAYQSLAAGATAAVLGVLWHRRRTAAMAAVALHPIVVVALVNGGHNDALVGLALVAAVLVASKPRPVWLGAALAAAVAIKIVAVLPAAALLAWACRRHGLRAATIAATTATAIVGGGYAAVGGFGALRPLTAAAGRVSRASPWGLDIVRDHGAPTAALLVATVVIPAALLVVPRLRRGSVSGAAAAATAGATPYLLVAPYVLPWYFAWALPTVALANDTALAAALLVDTSLVELAYTYRVVARPDGLDLAVRAVATVTQVFALGALAALVALVGAQRLRAANLRLSGREPRLP